MLVSLKRKIVVLVLRVLSPHPVIFNVPLVQEENGTFDAIDIKNTLIIDCDIENID